MDTPYSWIVAFPGIEEAFFDYNQIPYWEGLVELWMGTVSSKGLARKVERGKGNVDSSKEMIFLLT